MEELFGTVVVIEQTATVADCPLHGTDEDADCCSSDSCDCEQYSPM